MHRTESQAEVNNRETLPSLGFHEFVNDSGGSALGRYQDLAIGNRSLWRLLLYEATTVFLTNLPGLLGLYLRQKLYRFLLADIGKGTVIGTGVSLRQPSKISIGRCCVIDDLASLSVRGSQASGIQLADHVLVGRGSILTSRDGLIQIGEGSTIGSTCRIGTFRGLVSIGSQVMIAAYCYIGGINHKTSSIDIPMAQQGSETRGGVTIEDDVWIGSHTIVLDGVTIGKGSIIGAGSLVNKDIPPYSVAFGSPASVHKTRTDAPVKSKC